MRQAGYVQYASASCVLTHCVSPDTRANPRENPQKGDSSFAPLSLRIFVHYEWYKDRMLIRYIVALLLLCVVAQAQSSLAVHDSSMLRGRHTIPLYATLNIASGDSVCADIHFNPQLVAVHDLSSAQVNVTQLLYNLSTQSQTSATLHLSFLSNGLNLQNAAVLQMHIELLAGPDTLTTLSPTYLCRNGQSVGGATFTPGTMYMLDDIPVKPIQIEYLSTPFPHPGSNQSFKYKIIQKCSPSFTIFDVAGRELIHETLAEQEAGTYTFRSSDPEYATLCDAVYFLRLVTPIGVYVVPFEVLH